MSNQIVLTGDRPTGALHLGHYVGSLQNRLTLQEKYECFILIADIQALTDNFDDPTKVKFNVHQLLLDYLAVGIDPKKTTICVQSQIPELFELTTYFLNLVTINNLERNPTVKHEAEQKGYDSIPAGFFIYPVSQAADIALFQSELVPVGEDQLPHLEETNRIVRKFNRIYGVDALKECQPILSETKRLVGTDGKSKMSKSLGNAILLSDNNDTIHQKVMGMFTDPKHQKVNDPGDPNNPVFEYLTIFHPDKNYIEELKSSYSKGGLGDVKVKNILSEVLIELISPIREKRIQYSNDMFMMTQILKSGTETARQAAAPTIKNVRRAMHLNVLDVLG